jgi:hypothetical protein
MRRTTVILIALAAVACERPATQLIVVVDTDYAVPGELGFVRAVVRDEAGVVSSSLERELVSGTPSEGQAEVPCSFAVVPKDGDAERTVIIEIEGRRSRAGAPLVARRAVTGFRKGKTLLLRMFLAERCEDETCGADLTCSEDGCVSDVVSPNDLPEVTPGRELPARDAGPGEVDAGPGDDAGCPPSPGEPAVIATLEAPHSIDRALLTADLDGDGVGEILVPRGGGDTSAMSVIDFDACGIPSLVSTSLQSDLKRAPAFVEGASGPEIWLPTRLGVEAWRYSLDLGTPLERTATILETTDLEALAISTDGLTAGAVLRHAAWGMAHLGTQNRQEVFHEEIDRPRSLTYVGEVSGGALFAGASATMLYFLEPGGSVSLPLAALVDPMAVGPDAAFGSASAAVVVARADRAIVSIRVDLSTRATVTSSMSFPASIAGEPLLMRVQNEVRVYVRLASDLLTWCTISADAGSVACTPANPDDGFESGDEMEEEYANNLLSAYLDDDATPDLVLMTKEGEVHFRSGVRPADRAAPLVRLDREPKLPAVLLPRFWEPFGRSGDLMAVPFEDGKIILISWAAPPSAPSSADALWTQPRRDAQRSAHLP